MFYQRISLANLINKIEKKCSKTKNNIWISKSSKKSFFIFQFTDLFIVVLCVKHFNYHSWCSNVSNSDCKYLIKSCINICINRRLCIMQLLYTIFNCFLPFSWIFSKKFLKLIMRKCCILYEKYMTYDMFYEIVL